MKIKILSILALLLTVTQGAWAQTLPTDGTGAYLISSVDDWNTFCEDVTGGITYSGKFVKLTSNISVSTKADGNFSGTFDGDGHTITANISGTGSMALFHTLNGGTIKNLTVAGSISGNMHTAALLVSLGNGGTNIIENCVVTADVTCSSSHMGGFLAHGNSSNITIRGCVFKGKMTGGGTAKGVFYGWGDNGGTGSVTDCLYIMASGQDTDGLDLTKGSGIVTVTNCYKTASAGSQGTLAYASSNAPATLGSLVQDYGVVKAYQNSLLYDGKYYVAQTAVLNITSPSVGQVIGSDGKNYNYANLPSGVTPVAKIFYLEENRGLALAMSDESGTMQQAPAMTTCASHKAPFAGGTWKLASKDEWETMISAAGEYHNLRDGFAGVGGTNMHAGIYWSSTYMYFFNLGLNYWWDNHRMIYDGQGNFYVRACLEFSLLPIVEIEIGSTDDWNTFVENVNNGDSYINKHVKLTNDISVSTPVGSRADENSNRPFRGTFDGGGHTITVTFADDGNSGMAPFRYIDGATIKNLKVAGTIASSQQHTSGVVGYASGNNLIEDCVVTATLNISSNYAGGIVGHGLNSSTTIRGCAFTGTINGVNGNRGNVGGIWGWSDNATPTLVNCLEAGTYTNIASMHPMGLQSTSGTIADSYYLNVQMGEPSNACTVRGAKRAEAHATAPDDLGDMLVDYGMVQAYANGILFGGTYYVVYDLSGTGTENDPYIIANTDDWNMFATNVNDGDDYSGQFVKLTADITVSEMAGSSETNSFQGTFLGDAIHTLTFTKGSSESAFNEQYCAPFRYVKNATIQNLKVAGNIYTAQQFAAGLVARPYGSINITNCQVSTVIYSSVNGDGTHGGLAVRLEYATGITITGCVFTGRLLTNNGTTHCGGFIGWGDNKSVNISNSLYAPDSNIPKGWTAINHEKTFVRGANPTLTDCYFTEAMGDAQGMQVSTVTPAGGIYKTEPVTAADGNNYYAICTVSNVDHYYKYTGSVISVTPTVTFGSTTLTADVDYTYTSSPAPVQDPGDYTLTITGIDSYSGTKTVAFTVDDCLVKGRFTINANGDIVKFTNGNLQATTSDRGDNWTWQIAGNQWTRIGGSTANDKVNGSGTVAANGTVDLFSWVGASSTYFSGTAQYGINHSLSSYNSKPYGSVAGESLKSDWGTLFGGYYRTLTKAEWNYVFNVRESGSTVIGTPNARYTHATVHGVNGVILFPNDVNIDASEANFWGRINAPCDWRTVCNDAQWTALEAKGCVFLPVTGRSVYNTDMRRVGFTDECWYWTSTSHESDYRYAYSMKMTSGELNCTSYTRDWGMGVRMVRDYVTPHVANYAIADGDTYTASESSIADNATYTKSIGEDRVGKHQAWFVPFDYTITSDDLEKFDFFKIDMIAHSPDPSQNATDDIWVFLKKLEANDVLHANMPYVYKPKQAVDNYEFVTQNAVLKTKNTGVVGTMQTMEDIYTLYGTYEPTTATAGDPFYYVNIDGGISLGNNGSVTVGAFRWIMRQESKFGGTPVYAREIYFFDGDGETTGISEMERMRNGENEKFFDLQGRRVAQPTQKGLYIINGKKIVIK